MALGLVKIFENFLVNAITPTFLMIDQQYLGQIGKPEPIDYFYWSYGPLTCKLPLNSFLTKFFKALHLLNNILSDLSQILTQHMYLD